MYARKSSLQQPFEEVAVRFLLLARRTFYGKHLAEPLRVHPDDHKQSQIADVAPPVDFWVGRVQVQVGLSLLQTAVAEGREFNVEPPRDAADRILANPDSPEFLRHLGDLPLACESPLKGLCA